MTKRLHTCTCKASNQAISANRLTAKLFDLGQIVMPVWARKKTMKLHPLKVERELHGWSQAKVAEAVGTNVRTVIRWEQGQSVPYPYYREQLCSLFGKNVKELALLAEADETSNGQGEYAMCTGTPPLSWRTHRLLSCFSR